MHSLATLLGEYATAHGRPQSAHLGASYQSCEAEDGDFRPVGRVEQTCAAGNLVPGCLSSLDKSLPGLDSMALEDLLQTILVFLGGIA